MAAQAALTQFEWLIRAQPEEVTGTLEAALPDLLAQLARAGDERGLARAHLLAYWVHMQAARATPAAEQALLAAEHARTPATRACAHGRWGSTLPHSFSGARTPERSPRSSTRSSPRTRAHTSRRSSRSSAASSSDCKAASAGPSADTERDGAVPRDGTPDLCWRLPAPLAWLELRPESPPTSLPGSTRQSIPFARKWMRGSSPRTTAAVGALRSPRLPETK